jgi:predicted phage terminase large subunit-like protein
MSLNLKSNAAESSLDRRLKERFDRLLATKRVDYAELPLLDFVPSVTPKYTSPVHLEAAIPYLEACFESPQFFTLSAPPRHGKSETLFHFMAKYIAMFPDRNVAYASYSAKFAERKSMQVRDICRRAGVGLDKSSASRGTWRTEAGGYFFARGPGGDLTGEGIHLLVCDDPYRSRAEAESATIRDNIYDWWTSVAMTRLEPGASVVCSHTRWHMDDLTGRLTEEQGWPNISVPAIQYPYPDQDEGPENQPRALWPERYTLEDLARRRKTVGEYDWASMFMCQPRPRGGALFGATNTYTDEEFEDIKIVKYVIGIDLAYTSKTYSDFSVAVVLGIDDIGNAYVVEVRRRQCAAKDFAADLKALRLKYRSPQIIWFTGGQERAIAEFFRNSCGVPVKDIPAKEDKFVRAQAAATAWNTGRIFVPGDHKPWLDAFISEILSFTGVGDTHDDQVDALAAAFVPLANKKIVRGVMEHRLLSF